MKRIASVILALTIAANASALTVAKPAKPTNPPNPVVNVNTATEAQLAFLPGVGAKTAAAIIAGRPYVSVDDLLKVKGIGPAKLAKMRAYVVVMGQTTATTKVHAAKVGGAK